MWIRTDYDFGVPYKVFTVSTRHLALMTKIRDLLKLYHENPTELEKHLNAIIEVARPDLKGGMLVGIECKVSSLEFQLQYIHPSFQPRVMGLNYPDTEELIPEGERGTLWIGEPGSTVKVMNED